MTPHSDNLPQPRDLRGVQCASPCDHAAAKMWADFIVAYKSHADNWPAYHDIRNLARAYLERAAGQQQPVAVEIRRSSEEYQTAMRQLDAIAAALGMQDTDDDMAEEITKHLARIDELLSANNAEVERRRDIDRRWAEERARSQMEAEAPRSRINANGREALARDREHLTISGTFQSDKYPWCPAGFVPLKLTDSMARDLLLIYARRRAEVDKEFERDLVEALDRTKA